MFRRRREGDAPSAMLIGPLVVAALCLTAVSFWGFVRSRPSEVSDFSLLSSPQSNAVDRIQASIRIAANGAAGVPKLLELIKHPDEKVRRTAAYGLSQLPPDAYDFRGGLHQYLDDPDPQMRSRMLATVINQSGDEREDLKIAMRMFADPSEHVAHEARHTIAMLGQVAVPALCAAAENPDVVVRRNVVRTLPCDRIAGDASAETARRLLRDGDRRVRYHALNALKSMERVERHDLLYAAHNADYRTSLLVLEQHTLFQAAGDSELVRSLTHLLESSHAEIRTLSALQLAAFGPVAQPAIPALKRQLQRETGISQVCIADALAAAGAEQADYLPTLRKLAFATADEDTTCLSAAVIAKRAPSEASNILPRIVSNLRDPNSEVRYAAALATLGLGSAAEPAVDSLIQACHRSDPEIVALLNLAFGEFDRSRAQTLPFLIDQIRRDRDETELFLYESLPVKSSISPPFAELLSEHGMQLMQTLRPEFVRLTQESRKSEPIAAAIESLGRVGRGNPRALAAVLFGVDHPSSLVRGTTALALADIHHDSQKTVHALRQLVRDNDVWVKQRAVQAIVKLRK